MTWHSWFCHRAEKIEQVTLVCYIILSSSCLPWQPAGFLTFLTSTYPSAGSQGTSNEQVLDKNHTFLSSVFILYSKKGHNTKLWPLQGRRKKTQNKQKTPHHCISLPPSPNHLKVSQRDKWGWHLQLDIKLFFHFFTIKHLPASPVPAPEEALANSSRILHYPVLH